MMAELTTCVVLTGPPDQRGAQDHSRRCQLGGEPVHGADLVKLAPQGADQFPAAKRGTQSDHQSRRPE